MDLLTVVIRQNRAGLKRKILILGLDNAGIIAILKSLFQRRNHLYHAYSRFKDRIYNERGFVN